MQDDADSDSWGGQNVFDVYTKSEGTALDDKSEPGMWDFFKLKSSVLTPVRYIDQRTLLSDFANKVIAPAEAKAKELIDKMRS